MTRRSAMKDLDWRPNWETAEQYPPLETTTLYQWAWEFLRRNHEYQTICHELWEPHLRPPPEIVSAKFGVKVSSSFPHYRDNNPTDCELRQDEYGKTYEYHPILFKHRGGQVASSVKTDTEFHADLNVLEIKIKTINGNIVAPIIDLSLPINIQLAEIKRRLLVIQKQRGLVNKRIQVDKFPIYLRILDAIETESSKSEMADQLFPETSNSYPDYRGDDRVNDAILAASRYRDFDYRIIARASEGWPSITFKPIR